MNTDLIATLKSIVGDSGWVTDEATLEPHLTEWRGTWRGRTPIMVMPATTEEVAAVVTACAASGTAIVTQGGNTGLCGGAIPDDSGDQLLVSMRRMDRIRQVSADGYSMLAEAGCILANLHIAAEDADRYFPLSLAAEGSCQIGGNLSTNAGGINVLKYGTARDQLLGLEVVLPNGDIWDGLRALRKDTAGYDLKHLFVGAEGTLGIITAASLKLYPRPENPQTAMLAIDSPQDAIALFATMQSLLGDQLGAFELISARALAMVLAHIPDTRSPFDDVRPWYVLLEAAAPGGARSVADALMGLIEKGEVADAVLAKNDTERQQFWRLRHSISEAQKTDGASLKHDVSVPIGSVGRFIDDAAAVAEQVVAGSRIVAFGHVGDGNIHFNVSQPTEMAAESFYAERTRMADAIYSVVDALAGSISAEHGVGVLKREQLVRHRSTVEMQLMRTLKDAIDPDNRMNPGKVL